MTTPRVLALGLLLAAACSGSPTGPGGGNGPSGRIFFQWILPGDTRGRPQVVVIPAKGGTPERVPIWFLDAINPTVDTAGSIVAFMAPAYELATVSPNDSTIFHRVSQNINRSRPRISLDGRRVAMIFSPPLGANAEVRLIDLATKSERVVGVLPNFIPGYTPEYRVHAWFPGGDSLLVGARFGLLFGYFVVQTDGSRVTPFDFIPALESDELALSVDGRFMALSGTPRDTTGQTIEIWDLSRRAMVKEIPVTFRVSGLVWSPDERYLAYGADERGPATSALYILEVANGIETPMLPPSNFYISYLSWSR